VRVSIRRGRAGRSVECVGSQRLGGGDPVFGPGEAEEMVRELRGHLRVEQELSAQGHTDLAMRAAARATSITGDLARRLERRFERYAYAAFDDDPQLVDEAVAEMFSELCRRLRDTSATNDLFERRFNLVVKNLIIDAIRKVRVHNGFTRAGDPATAGFTVISLEAANERAETAASGEGVARPLEVADPVGEDAYERIVERSLGQAAVGWLHKLPARQRQVIEDRLFGGRSWTEVAARAGVSKKTAQADMLEALSTLRTIYGQTLGGDAK
jgi:RNA polymerase sigma factor (sigma-70 family)